MNVATTGPVRVVGTGLLGASVGLALTQHGVDVQLQDPSRTALALARDVGAGTPVDAASPAPALVVVAAPPDVTADAVAAALAEHPAAVVTDVASVKGHVLAELRTAGADLARYVGSHPMAGRERSGPSAAVPDLFLGRPWVLTDSGSSRDDALLAVRHLAVDLGAVPVVMDADEHDAAVAVVSHVPQLAASLVAARLRSVDDAALALAGQGLRDVTRLAASDPALWTSILAANAEAVRDVLAVLRDDLDVVLGALDRAAAATGPEDVELGALATIARTIADGGTGVARIPGKHGGAHKQYAVVTVLVPDQPGELARLLGDVGAAGVNLEDLQLEHAAGRPVGMASISVLPARAEHLETELTARGWRLVS
ncbi:Prephenate dehydrogenase [Cellulomonas flavigena DSM 20109]|uniref:Prephenate dehydrogenase n=1 Tax=Cellulomonas flavigena (strain ATCC 482 / DSM 20109 / BCRC 11376 / JCM 18109 / NBRC 3775 / NCIMB 8073 / NRS 134) TaxID=446466 RepID=D5UF12_CELFN|nr:prephenate dehydrogenase [Cellulomonas flavigena]ADG74822.1 Prephenate dehydrogenase [Cellulomonas flavigena DSM 20109]